MNFFQAAVMDYMWGGTVALEDIEAGLKEIKNGCR